MSEVEKKERHESGAENTETGDSEPSSPRELITRDQSGSSVKSDDDLYDGVDDDNAVDDDEILAGAQPSQLQLAKKTIAHISTTPSSLDLRVKKNTDDIYEVPWFAERHCLLLVLNARYLLRQMINHKLKQERMRAGNLTVTEIQSLLRGQQEEDDTDFVNEIQELKRNMVSEIRKNHVLERDLKKLDNRIALLIKNRGNIMAEVPSAKKKKEHNESKGADFASNHKKMEQYSHLFYLLQTEPKYLANLVYLMTPEQMDNFLETVIITLFGDAFSPREEFLTLKLFQLAIEKELSTVKKISDFLKNDSVVPKMLATYNRRRPGQEYLQNLLSPILKPFVARDTVLDVDPLSVFRGMINEEKLRTGTTVYDQNLSPEDIEKLPEVRQRVEQHVSELEAMCQQILNAILKSMKKLPYGMRWVCKAIRAIATQRFENITETDILKVTGYFVFYRFINVAITTPQSFGIVDKEPTVLMVKNLASVAKVLQNLFNLSTFGKNERSMSSLNGWIEKNLPAVREYFSDLIDVAEPAEALQVDKYMELTQKTKPVIIISLHEIAETHAFILADIAKLAKDKDDPLRIIMADLGEAPQVSSADDREINLVLNNRFEENMEGEISPTQTIYDETKELVITTLRMLPISQEEKEELNLPTILSNGKKFAAQQGNTQLTTQINKIIENLAQLVKEGYISTADSYASFLRDVSLEVANRAQIREQQRKEIKRLQVTLKSLADHQQYLRAQTDSYNDYLRDCRAKAFAPKKKKKAVKAGDGAITMIGPFKFSYNALQKKGVIIESDVPEVSRKMCKFYISCEQMGVFDIQAKIAGANADDPIEIVLDDLLEKNYNGVQRLQLATTKGLEVVLDVPLTIHLINKLFLK
eukprot:TRINITY_DN2330_c0_g1_i1.p1 TRINITY_DN2330_c0_g1~~TRINITY_DN2330_c0_g1_i1.p1  ORF type:complete len:873 (+),score=364.65 TRINITY_DN2330_c0_g1_i1:137-2755(+)